MPPLLTANVKGALNVAQKLGSLFPVVGDEAVQNSNLYAITTLNKYETPYSYVSWNEIGGFKTDRQRRFVMAAIGDGTIRPGSSHRTGRFALGWHRVGEGRGETVVNDVPYGPFLMGRGRQFAMHVIQGWPDIPTWLAQHSEQVKKAFSEGVQIGLQKLGLT